MYLFRLAIIVFIILFGNSLLYAHVSLDYPVGGEIFSAGETVTIQWHEVINHGNSDWDLFFSDDGGGTWQIIVENLPQSQITYNWTVLNNGTNQARVKVIQDNETGIDYEDESGDFTINLTTGIIRTIQRIEKFALHPAYPNPFNNSTTISFDVPEKTDVGLAVYNVLGEEVTTLLNKELESGSYRVHWNPSDMPSGIYFYKIEAETYVQVRQIILIK